MVGDERPTDVPVVLTREQPAYGGPVAAAYAGRDALRGSTPLIVVLAVDMPAVTAATVGRLVAAARRTRRRGPRRRRTAAPGDGRDGGGARRRAARPGRGRGDAGALGGARTWRTSRPSRRRPATSTPGPTSAEVLAGLDRVRKIGSVNLHDWIDELCDVLDIDTEVDEALVLDLAKVAARQRRPPGRADHDVPARVRRRSAARPNPEEVETLAAQAQALAEGWDRPGDAPDPVDVDDDVPDDSTVDHTGDDEFDGRVQRPSSPRGRAAPRCCRSPTLPDPEPGPGEVAARRRGHRGQPGRPAAAAGPLPTAARRLRRARAGVQRHRRGGRRRASPDWSVGDECCALLAGGGYADRVVVPGRTGDAGARRGRPGRRRRAARGRVHGVVQRVHGGRAAAAASAFLVHGGAGGIGTFAIQLAAALGARVIDHRRLGREARAVRRLGAEVTIDYREQDFVRGARVHRRARRRRDPGQHGRGVPRTQRRRAGHRGPPGRDRDAGRHQGRARPRRS